MKTDYKNVTQKAKELVAKYSNGRVSSVTTSEIIQPEDVYVVWYAKTLQNVKLLLSTDLPDNMYYEVTYNGDKKELYFDAYEKIENVRVEMPD